MVAQNKKTKTETIYLTEKKNKKSIVRHAKIIVNKQIVTVRVMLRLS